MYCNMSLIHILDWCQKMKTCLKKRNLKQLIKDISHNDYNQPMRDVNEELLQEAMDFVNNLHTVRHYDSTWDEYMQYVLENS